MASLESSFRAWLSDVGTPAPPVELLRVEDETLVLSFAGQLEVSMMPVEGSSFMVEAMEDASDAIEAWLTEANTWMDERPKLSLGDALTSLCKKAPKYFSGPADVDMQEEDDDDLDIDVVQGAASRDMQRGEQVENQKWDNIVELSATQGSRQASQVLMREMRALLSLQGDDGKTPAMEIEMVSDSLYEWSVKMTAEGFPEKCLLMDDLRQFAKANSAEAAVVMHVVFPREYPMFPPFIRVVRPRFQMHSGHVTIGGSVCMQLLTPSGWLPSVSLENVFVSIRSEMVEGGGRLDFSSNCDYTMSEAQEAFNRVASRYGWLK